MTELKQQNQDLKLNSSIQSEPLTTIELDGRKITILGTAHVSQASADKVQELIATHEYDAVAVELCPSRHNAIVNPDSMAKMDLFKVVKSGQASMVAASLALSAYQQRMAEQFGIEPGAEMKIAISDAQKFNLPVALIDREIGTTLKRVYRNVPWWKRFSLFSGLFASIVSKEEVTEKEIEHLKEGDVLESTFSQFAEDEQDLFKPLINERDQFMSASLIKELRENDYQHILAIVGAGHMKGMEKILKDRTIEHPTQTIAELNVIPEGSKWVSYIPWFIVALILIGFTIGFSRSPDLGLSLILDWVLINGGLAAIGALIAMAHPLTILTAFVAAPITSLNPMIGAGMVTAAAEIYLRKPQVGDFSRLRSDATSLKGWWNNQVTRILLIFILSSFGSAIGTYVAGFRIFGKLSGA
ncbi:MAG: TraB/GumN family protein [Gammaproteobacteria bacterium]|nr:TraB/GumN family protein [Gammaproteobacteria bacterium]